MQLKWAYSEQQVCFASWDTSIMAVSQTKHQTQPNSLGSLNMGLRIRSEFQSELHHCHDKLTFTKYINFSEFQVLIGKMKAGY